MNRANLPETGITISDAVSMIGGCEIDRITSVWNRRSPDLVLPAEMPLKWRKWCEQEFTHALLGALLRCKVHWVSDPLSSRKAAYKVLQLRIASQVSGFQVPEYVVTSDPIEAEKFVRQKCGGDAVVKPLGRPVISDENSISTVFTNLTSKIDSDDWGSLRYAPSIFQALVHKVAEVRVTVVGTKIFAARIEVATLDHVDYRTVDPYKLQHSVVSLPPNIAQGCVEMLHFFGLRFGALDFVIDQHGEYYFLELNPNGQWLWVEEITGLPIAEALAQELCSQKPEDANRN
jgi:glutathione synthase/RimK-type ligase-like ATP-grasp enzyme